MFVAVELGVMVEVAKIKVLTVSSSAMALDTSSVHSDEFGGGAGVGVGSS